MSVLWLTVETPLPTGRMRVGVTDRGVVAAAYTPQGAAGLPAGPLISEESGDRRAAAVAGRFADYFAGRRRELELPLDWRLTSGAQQAVLRALQRTVGFGRTITYGELAERSGAFEAAEPEQRALAARTVGSIMGSNPICLLVPCHRVVAADGIGGFGGGAAGLAVKRWLLTLEGSLAPTLDWAGPS
ncbi:methylated-DNA--[protein]-cysteine S-methyltransferase [Streptomyces sp. NPDC005970]|uniref:methylated-DNA--[protein]-cysteine S-methyltransferase n=1 Tax=Streptomyces sp. NPDC005970 TaxID=3156723 RepID=UPI0034109BD2